MDPWMMKTLPGDGDDQGGAPELAGSNRRVCECGCWTCLRAAGFVDEYVFFYFKTSVRFFLTMALMMIGGAGKVS